MAAITWFATNSLVSVHQEMSETSPGGDATASPVTGWIVGTGAINHSAFNSQVERAAATFVDTAPPDGTIDTVDGDCLRTTDRYSGEFAGANWDVNFACIAVTNGGSQDGRMRCRLFRGPNTDGSGATEITDAQQLGGLVTNLTTSAQQTSTATFNPGPFSVTNEFIFVQLAWERTGAGGMTNADVDMRVGTTATRVVSADFAQAFFPKTHYPDSVERPKHPTHLQQHLFQTLLVPAAVVPEITPPVYPNSVHRPAHPAHLQQAHAMPVQPEETIPLDWQPWDPDRVERAKQRASVQPFFATPVQPEEKIPLDWQPHYPDRADRTKTPVSAHQAFAAPVQPEETVPLDWHPRYSDRAERAKPSTTIHPFFAMPVQPEETAPLDWQPHYPERVLRAPVPANLHQTFATSAQPEETIPLDWAPRFPDHVERASVPANIHRFFVVPEFQAPLPPLTWAPSFPDEVRRSLSRPPLEQFHALYPFPVAPVEEAFPFPHYPDRIVRPFLPVAHHPATFLTLVFGILPTSGIPVTIVVVLPLVRATIHMEPTMVRTLVPVLAVCSVVVDDGVTVVPADANQIFVTLCTPRKDSIPSEQLGTIVRAALGKYTFEFTYAVPGDWEIRFEGTVDTLAGPRRFESEPFVFKVKPTQEWV